MNLQPPPGFPTCPGQAQGETIPEYAARVLRFLLACQTTASLTDDQLTQADHAAQLAICNLRGPDGKASSLEPSQERIMAVLSAARNTALSALDWRRRQHRHAEQDAHAPTGGKQPGRPAPLQPPPPQLPPAEDAKDFVTTLRQEVRRQQGRTDGIRF